MDGQMDGCMNAWMDGRTDGWMDRWLGGQMYVCTDGWIDGWMDGQMDVVGGEGKDGCCMAPVWVHMHI